MTGVEVTVTQLAAMWIFAGIVAIIPAVLRLSVIQKFTVIAIIFATVFVSFIQNEKLLGLPLHSRPQGEFMYIHHTIKKTHDQIIATVWVLTDDVNRLHRFSITKKEEQQLNKGRKRAKKGIQQMGNIVTKKARQGSQSVNDQLMIYDFPVQQVMPKE